MRDKNSWKITIGYHCEAQPHFLLKFCNDWWRFGRLRKMTKLFLMLDDVTPILLLLGAPTKHQLNLEMGEEQVHWEECRVYVEKFYNLQPDHHHQPRHTTRDNLQ